MKKIGFFLLLCISFTNAYNMNRVTSLSTNTYYMNRGNSGSMAQPVNPPSVTYKYDRIGEVKKECDFVLASASTLEPDDNRMYAIKEQLSFVNGDWWQEAHGAPLMPFDDREANGSFNLQSPMKLASFRVMDIDPHHQSEKSVVVGGILQLGITRDGTFVGIPNERSRRFDIWPSYSQLWITFQGIYTESRSNSGERVMCLLGNTMLPARQPHSTDPWEWVKESGYANRPPLSQDDRILLVLRYPKKLTLANRAIQGTMRSLNLKSDLKYFDEVHISSWLSNSVNYEFGSEKIVSKACNSYPLEDISMSGGIDVYKGLDFCLILDRFSHEEVTILPNWRCNGTDKFCSKLGPFMSDKEINATNGGFKDVKLIMQDFRCVAGNLQDNAVLSRVSAVLRAVPPFENQYNAAQRTGLNNMTLSAEGVWNSSSGLLCMAGCLGLVDAEGNGCNSRICLYVPLSYSIKQRNIIMGTISSIDGISKSYFPLSFEKQVRPMELWDQYTAARPYYRYSKLDSAGAVLEKDEPFNFGTIIKRSWLKFPKLENTEAFVVSLSLLSEDLTLHVAAFPDPIPDFLPPRSHIQMEIVSLGPLFGRYWSSINGTILDEETPYTGNAEYTEKQLLLNVSAQLTITGQPYNNVSELFLEGLYDQHAGKMYLIGCRDVRASWKILHESMDLEAGLDCLIEVVVAYPPTSARWLVNPTARVSISSQRNEDDPLYFSPVKLQTFPVMYRTQREDILSRRAVEGILRILTLSVAIASILSQLFYIKDKSDSVPYICLVMLGVQALGYSIPLITGAEAIFKKMAAESYERTAYDLERSTWLQVIDYTVKLLVLVSFSLTLRLCQKVWKSRIRLLTRSPLEPHRVPSEKRVIFVTLTIHAIGYIMVLIIHYVKNSVRPVGEEKFIDSSGNSQTLGGWKTELEEYVGLVQDFFLFPQIIGNWMWQINCKPLTKFYFIGITVVRVLPHLYDSMRSPIANPYFSEEFEFVNPRFDFYSRFGDIAIPAFAILLAVTVYVQQRWNYEKINQTLSVGQRKLQTLGSRVYERLPSSRSFEAELVSGVNGNGIGTHEKEHDVFED